MTYESIRHIFDAEIRRKGTNPFRCAKEANLPGNAIRNVLDGYEPRISRVAEICDALGLEFYVGQPRQQITVATRQPPQFRGAAPARNDAPRSQSAEDRDLAEMSAILADAWETAVTDVDRGDLRGRFKMAFREEWDAATSTPGPRMAKLANEL